MRARLFSAGVAVALAFGCVKKAGALSDEPKIVALRESCAAGNATACVSAAEHLFWDEPADHTPWDVYRRFQTAVRACELGEPNGCAIAGLTYHFHRHDDRRALGYLRKGCGEGSFTACFALHELRLGDRRDIRPDPTRVVHFLEAACGRGMAVECTRAGVLIISGYAGSKDARKGVDLLERACDDEPTQCQVLAAFYRDGDAAKANTRKVQSLCNRFEKGYVAHRLYDGSKVPVCPMPFSQFENLVRVLVPSE